MAIKNTLEEDQALQAQNATGGLNTSGVVGSNTAAGGQAAVATAQGGSGFTNLDKYLGTNEGQGSKLAGDATADLSKQANGFDASAKAATDKAATDYSGISKTATDTSASLQSGLASDASGTKAAAAKFLGAGYQAPTTGDYTNQLKVNADKLNQNLGQVDKAEYQGGLLKNAYQNNGLGYSNGFNQLDSFLMGADKSGRDVINGVKAKSAGVTANLDTANKAIGASDQAARTAYGGAQQQVRDTAASQYGKIDQDLNSQLAAKNSGLVREGRTGVKDASLGDVGSNKNRLDLQALAQLSGQNYDAGKYSARTFDAGQEIPWTIGDTGLETYTRPIAPAAVSSGAAPRAKMPVAVSPVNVPAELQKMATQKQDPVINAGLNVPDSLNKTAKYLAPRLKKII